MPLTSTGLPVELIVLKTARISAQDTRHGLRTMCAS
ncbi:MAG: hypothetical protein JWO71_3446 [Candidatus Acidoferrum typicum]|nr:hypothetical protein [Candidatus Acidoferrum typicum]